QGLLLVTIGFISKFSGLQLALILAAESVVLLMVGQQRKNWILRAGSYATAGMAVGWGMDGMHQFDNHGLVLGVGLGALMLVSTFLADRYAPPLPLQSEQIQGEQRVGALPANPLTLRTEPGYFAALSLLIWLIAVYDNCTRANFPLVLTAIA